MSSSTRLRKNIYISIDRYIVQKNNLNQNLSETPSMQFYGNDQNEKYILYFLFKI